MKSREVEKRLRADGWFALLSGKANYKHYKHPRKPGKVTVPIQPDGAVGDLNPITVKNIEKHSGVSMG